MSANFYNYPEDFGFETVKSKDFAGAWEFAIIVVVADTGKKEFYYAMDSGCSCPSPFETQNVNDLKVLNEDTWADFVKASRDFVEWREGGKEIEFFLIETSNKIREWDWKEHQSIIPNPFKSEGY